MKLFYLLILMAYQTIHARENRELDLGQVANLLRIPEAKLKIEVATERESEARKLALVSAWIISVPGEELFFPLVIYTSRKGVLNNQKYSELKKFLKETPPKEGVPGHGLGSFDVQGIDDSFIFFEEIPISSNRPATAKSVLAPWKPVRETGFSIIGTVDKENMDFQIFVIIQDENRLEEFPEYKSMLHGPDLPNYKELGAALVTVVRDSEILKRDTPREDKRSGAERKDGDKAGAELGAGAKPGQVESANEGIGKTGTMVWLWVILTALLGTTIAIRLRRGNQS